MGQRIKKNVGMSNSAKMKSTKDKLRRIRNKAVIACMGAATAVMLMNTTCYASGTGTTAVTQPLDNLKTLIIAVIGAVGVIILVTGVTVGIMSIVCGGLLLKRKGEITF